MNCPKCNSTHVARCEVAFLQGTTTGSIRGGGVIDDSGISNIGMPTTTQSGLARLAAPLPRVITRAKEYSFNMAFFCGIPTAALAVTYLINHPLLLPSKDILVTSCFFSAAVLPIAIFGFVGWLFGFSLGQSQKERAWQLQHEEWKLTWICYQCGQKYIIKNMPNHVLQRTAPRVTATAPRRPTTQPPRRAPQ